MSDDSEGNAVAEFEPRPPLDAAPPRPPSPLGVSEEAAAWAIRLFVGREPSDGEEVEFHRQHRDMDSLRRAFASTGEFKSFYRKLAADAGRSYRVPLFLLEPPPSDLPRSGFEAPTFERPASQLCTENQFSEPSYVARATELQIPMVRHRKFWEWCYILQAMYVSGVVAPGKRALGFGTGREPLPSLLASRGMTVLATDAPIELDQMQGWTTTGQHSQATLDLFNEGLIDRETFLERVSFRSVDMTAIPADLVDFDVCWSSCSFEHLGSIEAGLAFVENSLRCLRPGGMAIHTTEFNLDSNDVTLETTGLSIFRKRDLEELCRRLMAAGCEVWPLNFHPGLGKLDEVVDLPPFALPHLKLQIANVTTTSIGIVVRRPQHAE